MEAGAPVRRDWREFRVSGDGSHHLCDGRPVYGQRFLEVLKFHPPGLAPVLDASGAYHITPDGRAAYGARYLHTFGFYEGRAAVMSSEGWHHILQDGTLLYPQRYAWCGNYLEARCAVRESDGQYVHLTAEGTPAYRDRYRYAGDFKDGFAVVQGDDGRHTHIDAHGGLLHGRWFRNLDVFHKNFARACDSRGWHHVYRCGRPLYEARFRSVEPFYNGQARVEGFDGSLSVMDETGKTLLCLRRPVDSPFEDLSSEMVGMWRTQTIRAAVESGVFEALPASILQIQEGVRVAGPEAVRLLRALTDMKLVRLEDNGTYLPTGKGALLQRSHPHSLADAALMWGGETYAAWARAVDSLQTGESAFEALWGENVFSWLGKRPKEAGLWHRVFSAYARHDYRDLGQYADFGTHDSVLDAGGGTGELSFALLRSFPRLTSVVMDRPEVIGMAKAPPDVDGRCRFVAGDLFLEWPVRSDAVVLARVLHDWPDRDAVRILERAREAISEDGRLYVVEMVLDDASGRGGLLDLNMLVMTGGAERTEEQFRQLFKGAGFELLEVTPTNTFSSILRARLR